MRRLGVTNAFLYVISRGLARYSGGRCRIVKYYFVAQPVAASASALDAGAISIAPVSPDDRIVKEFPRPPDVISRRFRDDAICLVARKEDEFAGYLWLNSGGMTKTRFAAAMFRSLKRARPGILISMSHRRIAWGARSRACGARRMIS